MNKMNKARKRMYTILIFLGLFAGIYFSSSTALAAVANQIVRVGDTVSVTFTYPGGYDYSWYPDNDSIVKVTGSGTKCDLTGRKAGTTTVHCVYKFDNTYYDWILKRPVTDTYVEEIKFSVTVTNGEVSEGDVGEVVNPRECDEVKEYSSGLIRVKQDNLWGFVDKDWKLVIPFQFDSVLESFDDCSGTAAVQYNGSPYALTRTGKLFGPLNSRNFYFVRNDVAMVRYRTGEWVWIKGDGTAVEQTDNIACTTDVGDDFLKDDVLIPARSGSELDLWSDGLYGYVDKNYKWVIPPQFERAREFHGDRAIVCKDGRYHVIDRSGQIVSTPPKEVNLGNTYYYYAGDNGHAHVDFWPDYMYFADGLCPATDCTRDGYCAFREECHNFFYINEAGEKVITDYLWGSSFEDGMAVVVNRDGYEGVINTKNEVLIPFQYLYTYSWQKLPGGGMSYLGEGVFAFHSDFDEPYILLDSSGNRLTNETYDSVKSFHNGIAQVCRNGLFGYINPKGVEVIPATYYFLKFFGQSQYALGEDAKGFHLIEHPVLFCSHKRTEIRNQSEASCTKDGYTGDTYCLDCGQQTAQGKKITAAGHKFSWVVDREATTAAAGEKHQECTVCGVKQKEHTPIDKLEDTSGKDDTKEPDSTGKDDTKEPDSTGKDDTKELDSTGKDDTKEPDSTGKDDIKEPDSPEEKKISLEKADVRGITDKVFDGTYWEQSKMTVYVDGKKLQEGKDYKVTYQNNKNVGTASMTITGIGNYYGSVTETFQITVEYGSTYDIGGLEYYIDDTGNSGRGAVTVTSLVNKNITKLKIPTTVTIGGRKFAVTAVGRYAFFYCTKLKTVTIGNNVSVIGECSFDNCRSLTKVTLGTGVTKISERAFGSCYQLKTLKISSKKLKTVGRSAIFLIHKKAVIRVPASKVKAYRRLFKSKTGFRKTMKVKK